MDHSASTDAPPNQALDVVPISAVHPEEAAHMDLAESRPSYSNQMVADSSFGPPLHGPIPLFGGCAPQPNLSNSPFPQVSHPSFRPYTSSLIPSNFIRPILPFNAHSQNSQPNNPYLPNNSQPNMSAHPFPSSKKSPLPFQPTLLKNPTSSQLRNNSHSSSSPSNMQVMQQVSSDHEMADFPPLEPSFSGMENHGGKPIDKPKSCWADLAAGEPAASGRNHSGASAGPQKTGAVLEGQPNVHFGKSMADVLRSGQPQIGPVLLDRNKAEKRGEVRMVEGKPCLFFSANETSNLAGRLGPSIVGKFSHSIPSAQQIQKALGNIKLVGSLTWNFLNAKHVYIELSDMRDYVKLLNGPNNSPVWYIEHHPMRVFKWTPDFDPFFETPIITAWCNILALPVHLFEESSLIAIGQLLGNPVQVDRATIDRTRVSFARLCVEIDLSRPIVDEIELDIAGKRVTLKVKWEKIPLYCNECKHVGHSALTCYASGKRPMPPKRDYSRGQPQNRQPPNRPDQPRQPEQPRQQVQPSFQPATRSSGAILHSARQPPEVREQLRSEKNIQAVEEMERDPSSGILRGSSSSAAKGKQVVEDDGFTVPKKKNKGKKAAAKRRYKERRQERLRSNAAAAKSLSDGERDQGVEGDASAAESERGSRSLSPSRRVSSEIGPLALVVHDGNMFGALDHEDSDECIVSDEPKDHMVIEDGVRRITFARPVIEYIGSGRSPPPSEGAPKRQKFSASATY